MENNQNNKDKRTSSAASNERFGASGGVIPQEKQSKLASEYPAGTVVFSPPAPSRRTLNAMAEKVQRKTLNINGFY
jgi:hypothetical protein